ncbi:MAG: aminoacyl-tRNA hydrolase [gamma proteobacterium symbiont of Bathyaustriella thionipta]|nr:aminoacyl-tRNA hydrolase [gamma proteobacterium symbiont of Bathyaustriella thionipta]MCU7950373.1 aminoacyl-tRNA hydrolase [gamma proteobacterium symbiont of Bathyaustriella thionipta]MCU7954657.1 aminoacyl-tRNA hydrolase [gamma proteobacterium symbiont of Bathyaustriella thionipta]MCU7956876.1 aminoacyl-tRNA hydrolase [gamma proteobacterium symbiont of Bathyaustriella thionipta]MCU7966156.1 aminoacyl-tRNA hydrolase [gamma proteobacterium symbiont of Bathyaustriella thionipta]
MSSDSNSIQFIAGLGNPGNEYEKTRHNAGFWFIDQLISHYNLTLKNEAKFLGDVAKLNTPSGNVWLLKPTTFMNRSGQSIARLAQFYKIKPEQILVVHDELDLSPGIVKLKQGGGHGGHNGLRDSIAQLGKNFYRLRLGIGHPGNKEQVVGFVLGKTPQSEKTLIETSINKSIDVIELILQGDMQKAMNQLHAK